MRWKMDPTFWKENGFPIGASSIVSALFVVSIFWAMSRNDTLHGQYERLVRKGDKRTGEVVSAQPFSHMLFSDKGPSGVYAGINVELSYTVASGRKDVFYEVWPLGMKDEISKGDKVPFFYLEENPDIKIASIHHPKIRSFLSNRGDRGAGHPDDLPKAGKSA